MAKNPDLVQVILLKDGTQYGPKGKTVGVTKEVAKHLCMIRKTHLGGESGHTEYRMAKPADEVEPPIPIGAISQGEAAALGIRNVVETPPDTILPKGMAGLPVPGDADFDETLGVNQKPRVPGAAAKPKKLTKRQQLAADKRAAKAAANDTAGLEDVLDGPEGEDDEDSDTTAENGAEGESAQT